MDLIRGRLKHVPFDGACFFLHRLSFSRALRNITVKKASILAQKGSSAEIGVFCAFILVRYGEKGAFSKLDLQIGPKHSAI